jgi:hypothetical protein
MADECPPSIPMTSDPAIIYLAHELQRLYGLLNSPTHLTNVLNKTVVVKGAGGANAPRQAIVGDNKWIRVNKVGNQLKINHIGPEPKAVTEDTISGISVDATGATKYLVITSNPLPFDDKGHHCEDETTTDNQHNLALQSATLLSSWSTNFSVGGDSLTLGKTTIWAPLVAAAASQVVTLVRQDVVTEITSITASTSGITIAYKKKPIVCFYVGSESTASAFAGSTSVQVVIDNDVDDTNYKLQHNLRTIYVLGAAAADGLTDYYTGTVCP